MNTVREAVIAARLARKVGLPFVVSFTVNGRGDILSGESWDEAVRKLAPYVPDAILANCAPAASIDKALQKLRAAFDGEIGAYASGFGSPSQNLGGWEFSKNEELAIGKYIRHVERWIDFHPLIIGGCCGTTPRYIENIVAFVQSTACANRAKLTKNNQ